MIAEDVFVNVLSLSKHTKVLLGVMCVLPCVSQKYMCMFTKKCMGMIRALLLQ